MTARQTILEILDDSRSQEELILRLSDFVISEQDRYFAMGEKAGRHGAKHDALVERIQNKAAPTLAF